MYATGLAAPQILVDRDPEAARAVELELARQQNSLVLIASENHASQAVLEASASVMTNKYAEGYPGRRYYGGCEFVDMAESLAIERVNRLFGSEHANVQAHSGTQANIAVYTALMQPGETLMGMRLDHGGHLSHGSPVNFTGKYYNIVSYGVDPDTELIDYEQVESLAKEHRPKFIVAGYSAYARTVDWARFRAIADEVGAILLVDMAHIAGLVAGGVHPNPVPHAQIVTSTTHKSLRGPRGAFILSTQEHARALDRSVFPVNQGGPFMAAILAKAVCFGEALQPGFAVYAQRIVDNAQSLAATLTGAGLRIVTGGTDNHLFLVDLRAAGLTGREAEQALNAVGVIVNRNTIPNDPQPATVASGLRIGTPALSTRGMGPDEMATIGKLIAEVLTHPADEAVQQSARDQVADLTSRFPVPGITTDAAWPLD
ncbi:MAG: serine hydroxymethyltransferase [Chloroflexi bacterium]|nr:serine hydroxymethyltransferase [Chloroflexota bacterium]